MNIKAYDAEGREIGNHNHKTVVLYRLVIGTLIVEWKK